MAGICQAGDILGLIDGDVAVIGADVPATARTVLDRMLAAGGELVTLVLGEDVLTRWRTRWRSTYARAISPSTRSSTGADTSAHRC